MLFSISLDLKTGTMYKTVLLNWADGASPWTLTQTSLGTDLTGTATLTEATSGPSRQYAQVWGKADNNHGPTLHGRKLRQPPHPCLVLGDPHLSRGNSMLTNLPPNLG